MREQHALSEAPRACRGAVASSRSARAAVHVREVCGTARPLAAGGLRATAPLLAQARRVTALGDVPGDGRPAALTSSRAALLTPARAGDRVGRVGIAGRPAPVCA